MDPRAWRDILDGHAEFALGLARARLSRAALPGIQPEDLVQEIWVRLLKGGLERLDPERDLRPYLAVAILHEVRQQLRRARRRERMESLRPFPAPPPEAPEEPMLRQERRDLLERALGRLDPGDRSLLRWIYWEGLSYADAADLAGLKADGLGSYLSRARRRLREEVERERKTGVREGGNTE